MKTKRGTIGMWATMLIGVVILALQGYKYATDTLYLGFSELGLTIVAAVLIFAPKVLSEAFGKLLDKYLGNNTVNKMADSIGGGGIKNKKPKGGNG